MTTGRHGPFEIIMEKSLEIWQKGRVQIAKRGHKTPFCPHNTCNEVEGLGWSRETDFLPSLKVSLQPGLPQFYNVLEFTFTCLLTILQHNATFSIRLTSTFAIWYRKLWRPRQTLGGRWGVWWGMGEGGGATFRPVPHSREALPTEALKRGKKMSSCEPPSFATADSNYK